MQVNCRNSSLIYANFNQEKNLLCLGSRHGYEIYSVKSQSVQLKHKSDVGGCQIVEMHGSNVLVVGNDDSVGNTSRFLKIYRKNELYNRIIFPTSILSICTTKLYYAICTAMCIYVFNRNGELLKKINTYFSEKGVMALRNNFLAYLSDEGIDIVDIEDNFLLRHRIPYEYGVSIGSLAINWDLTKVAYVDETGKRIEVYDIGEDPEKPILFKRGNSCKTTYVPSFSRCGSYISISSPQTVHIFKIEHQDQDSGSYLSYIKSAFRPVLPLINAGEPSGEKIVLSSPANTLVSYLSTDPIKPTKAIIAVIKQNRELYLFKPGELNETEGKKFVLQGH